MIAIELVQASNAVDLLAHVPVSLASAAGDPTGIDTQGIVKFFAGNIAPILLAVLGVIFIGRASKGEISKVLTSSAIAIVGLAFIAGAATLFFVGDYLIDLIFQ
jgi:type IV secretory pathway VirB2 component (pilin)